MRKRIEKFFSKNYLLIAILSLASFLRLFRINELLGFWYDQGRDALAIWGMLHEGKMTLIGQQMGFTGIFRGGWFYWILAPFYAIGGGNPIWPTVFLVATSVVAIYLIYRLGTELGGRGTGFLAALIAATSYYIISASNWLSGTTPELLVSMLIVWTVFSFLKKKIWAIPLLGFLVGMSLQFEGAAEVYLIPAIIIILALNKKLLPKFKVFLLGFILFLAPAIPQALFELRHPGVLSGAIINLVFHEKTFTFQFWEIIKTRMPYYYQLFSSKFWINGYTLFAPFFATFVFALIFRWKEFWKNNYFRVIFIFAVAPFIGTLFFVSNKGAVYDYYFTCYYLIWILFFSFVLVSISKKIWGRLIIAAFLTVMLFQNVVAYTEHYFISVEDPNYTTFYGELKTLDWIYNDAGGKNFNVDVYVPPVIPYEFDYLFKWYGNSKYGYTPSADMLPLLYTIHEIDNFHPTFLSKWLDRQETIGKIEKSAKFGGITVERRTRYK
jgi:4-amino-4-deoxy-L-arabinose transferase-like glycosyltransferase